MAIPILYWMLECTGCGARRVVHDCYLVYVGFPEGTKQITGEGYVGPPLEERYSCTKGCAAPLRTIGSIWEPDEREMWLHEPHEPVEMNRKQRAEWSRLIREAGLEESEGLSMSEDERAARHLQRSMGIRPKPVNTGATKRSWLSRWIWRR